MNHAADRLRHLWATGRRPDLGAFVGEVGPLDSTELAAVLRADQAERWAAGTPLPAEEYLRQFPAAAADPEAAIDLIHNEYLLSERHGTPADADAFVRRFPAYADTLRLQIDLHREMGLASTADHSMTTPSVAGLPEQFGRYRIRRLLGRGGMGSVYAAYDTHLERTVALKVPTFLPGDRTAAERFLREGRIAAGLSHPNLCPVYDVGEVDGIQYLTMPVVDGESLADRLRRDGRLPPDEAVRLTATVARAVAVAHAAAGVVHRDLKPANILFDGAGTPIVTDFGLARRGPPGERGLTASGAFVGTPAYAAPEQIAAAGSVTEAADVYALGAILYECLTGRPPFVGPAEDVLRRKLTEEPAPPSRVVPGLDPALDAICRRALAVSRDERFGSMREFAAALDQVGELSPRRARARRRWWPVVVGAVGAIALVCIGLAAVSCGGRPSPTTSYSGPPKSTAPTESDPLPVGSRWVGTHSFTPDEAGSWEPAGFRVAHRDGETFRGEADTKKGTYAWEVEGTIRGKVVRWKYVKVIREATQTGSVEGGAYAEGELKGDQLEMRYHDPGDETRATIRLTLQK